ncbi:MAG TPA: response regulator [Pirellulales bacterium]|jgi:CheY-like chemotaxis protein|nr:response regulator [Pirellulales bacterium]
MAIRILDVGQCGFDGPRMAALWRDQLGATVDRVANGKDAVERLKNGDYDVVLVNRVLAADGSSGLDVIEDLLSAKISIPVMLVSDLTDAQDAAVALGAVRGFGKADLGEPATLELVASVSAGKDGGER